MYSLTSSNSGRSLFTGFPNCPRSQLPALTSHNCIFLLTAWLQTISRLTGNQRQSQSYITTDGQSVLVSGTHLWPATNFLLLSLIIFRQLRICWCGAPSVTRSRICSFEFLLGIASANFLRSEFHGTHEHILLSLFFRLSQPGGPGSCI
jgi:hypothetical protein